MKTEKLTIRITPELKNQLEEIALSKNISMSSLVTLFIVDSVEKIQNK